MNKNFQSIIGKTINVLDKGFIEVINIFGIEQDVVTSARVSYNNDKKCLDEERDKKLINFLLKHNHLSPFEMLSVVFHLKVPIFIARQIVRHRSVSMNEVSLRYTKCQEKDFYIPSIEFICSQSNINKQCSGEKLSYESALKIQDMITEYSNSSFNKYTQLLEMGLSRESARMVLPLNLYTRFYWKINLRNLLHFLSLRTGKGAQKEIVEYAKAMESIVREWVPNIYDAYVNYNKESFNVSKKAIEYIRKNDKLIKCIKDVSNVDCDFDAMDFFAHLVEW